MWAKIAQWAVKLALYALKHKEQVKEVVDLVAQARATKSAQAALEAVQQAQNKADQAKLDK